MKNQFYYGHVNPVHRPVDPGYGGGRPPVDPDYGIPGPEGPVDPGYGIPEFPPVVGGGPIPPQPPVDPGWGIPVLPTPPTLPPMTGSGKPAGVPILPTEPSWTPPTAPPMPPGNWVTLDAGKGQPPAWGFIAKDTGLAPAPGGTLPPAGKANGHYVPVGARQPKDEGGPAAEPTWAWVPEIGADYGVKQQGPATPQPKR